MILSLAKMKHKIYFYNPRTFPKYLKNIQLWRILSQSILKMNWLKICKFLNWTLNILLLTIIKLILTKRQKIIYKIFS